MYKIKTRGKQIKSEDKFVNNKVRVLYLQFGAFHLKQGLYYIELVCNIMGLKIENIVIVDNSLEVPTRIINNKYDLINGNNFANDFSGYDCGIEYIKTKNPSKCNHMYLLCNDTFFRNYGSEYLQDFASFQAKLVKNGCLAGYTDSFPEAVEVFGFKIKKWIRSSILVLSYDTMVFLYPLLTEMSDDYLFKEYDKEFFSKNSRMCQGYKTNMRRWLFGIKSGGTFSQSWHSSSPLSNDNFFIFTKKFKCILSEHLLTARAATLGLKVFSINERRFVNVNEIDAAG